MAEIPGAGRLISWFRIPGTILQKDLTRLGIQVVRKRLSAMPPRQYNSLIERLKSFKKVEPFSVLEIDPPKKIKGFDFSALPDAFLSARVHGVTLDLTNLEMGYARFVAERAYILADAGRPVPSAPPPFPIPQVDPQQLAAQGYSAVPGPKRKISADTAVTASQSGQFDIVVETGFWDWVFDSGQGRGLASKIAGPVVEAHYMDIIHPIVGRVGQAITGGRSVLILEDAAGECPLVLRLIEALKEGEGEERHLPEEKRSRIRAAARDISSVAVERARSAVRQMGMEENVSVERASMFETSEIEDGTMDFILASMAFYCPEDRFDATLQEWARVAARGGVGVFSIKAHDGDLKVVVRDTIRGHWNSVPRWLRLATLGLFPLAVIIHLLISRWRSGAFEYGRKLREGFASGKYFSPAEDVIRDKLKALGLATLNVQRSLAGQFYTVEWAKLSHS